MKIYFLLFLAVLTGICSYAQNNEDSLLYYSKNIADTTSLNRLINYCFNHFETMPDAAYKYSKIAVVKSKELASKPLEARSITNLGAIEALKGNYPAALKLYLESLAIWEGLNEPKGIMLSKNNIAQIYGYLKKTELEFQFLKEAESIAGQYHYDDELGLIKLNLSVYYSNKGDFREALDQQLAAIAINLKLNKLSLASLGYSNAGGYLFFLHKIDSAIYFYYQSKKIGEQINDQKTIAISWANLAEAFETKGLTDTAIKYYGNAVAVAKPISLKDILVFSYEQLANIYKKKGDYNKAFQFTELKQIIKDSILNSTATRQLAEMQTKYETEKKERKISEQQFEISKRNYWIAGILFCFMMIGLVIYSFNRRKQLKQEALMQITLRKTEELAAKSILEAEENERERIASDLHDGVGQLMSVAKMNLSAIENEIPFINDEQKNQFEKVISLVDESCKEVRTVSHNMMPNALLKTGLANAVRTFLDNVNNKAIKINLYSEGLNERIDSNTEIILYRVIQEAVNNVIKHANATQLDITLIKDDATVSATIEDNGQGFDVAELKKKDGIGLKNIQSRIAYLKGTVDWDSQIGKGTAIIINVPC
ncbi:signal transduction histidine-protein kinase/phosphatase DegS [mine drainage metagenome]|uniref:histidine kinase n=1 Tax=mine drainage metagenome TaxID=410659 RepID=A0A1J5SEU8_9ZZZZ